MTPKQFQKIRLDLGLSKEQLATLFCYRSTMRISEFERGAVPIGRRVDMLMQALATGWRPKNFARLIEEREKA